MGILTNKANPNLMWEEGPFGSAGVQIYEWGGMGDLGLPP